MSDDARISQLVDAIMAAGGAERDSLIAGLSAEDHEAVRTEIRGRTDDAGATYDALFGRSESEE